jgi:tripeptide aminopeptidase
MDTLLDRFCRYVRIDTMADEKSSTAPTTPGQLAIGRLLVTELLALGARDAKQDEHGIILATIPTTISRPAPTIAFIAHVDTSPETTGKGVKPLIHNHYDGGDIILPGDPTKVLRAADNPELTALKGKTIVTTDGTTLLGGDDKGGVAVIMEATAYLLAHPEIPHGPIRVCFTCDEEVGRGVDHLDLKKLGAHVAYTLDGGATGELDHETFSADLAIVTVTGRNVHPGIAKGRMINAVRLAGLLLDRLPRTFLSPETTEDRQGFLHPYRIEGGVAEVVVRVLLRDHDTRKLPAKAEVLRHAASLIEAEYPGASVKVEVTAQYRNMADGLTKEPRAISFAEDAMRRAGITPRKTIVRGGTDGSRLTELGLPTPNIFCGEHNIHSPLEWTCLEEMQDAVRVLVELAQVWGAVSG